MPTPILKEAAVNTADGKDFDFITDEPEVMDDSDFELSAMAKMSPRDLANSILAVYQKLGGPVWLMSQAKTSPKAFFELLKKILPTNVKLDGLEALNISLVNAYVPGQGNSLQICVNENGKQQMQAIDTQELTPLEDGRVGLPLLSAKADDKDQMKQLASYEADAEIIEIATGGSPNADTPPSTTPSSAPIAAPKVEVALKETFGGGASSPDTSGSFNFDFNSD